LSDGRRVRWERREKSGKNHPIEYILIDRSTLFFTFKLEIEVLGSFAPRRAA
jgi:hypothetical protein